MWPFYHCYIEFAIPTVCVYLTAPTSAARLAGYRLLLLPPGRFLDRLQAMLRGRLPSSSLLLRSLSLSPPCSFRFSHSRALRHRQAIGVHQSSRGSDESSFQPLTTHSDPVAATAAAAAAGSIPRRRSSPPPPRPYLFLFLFLPRSLSRSPTRICLFRTSSYYNYYFYCLRSGRCCRLGTTVSSVISVSKQRLHHEHDSLTLALLIRRKYQAYMLVTLCGQYRNIADDSVPIRR